MRLFGFFSDLKSAFTVSDPTRGGSTIRFNNVITNVGSHYNTNSGQFMCHYPGTYVFSLHIFIDMDAHSYIIAYCYIRKNGFNQIRTRAKSEGSTVHSYYESSTSVVLHLKLNDKVDIGGCYGSQYISSDSLTTSFSGFLVQAD